MGTNHFFAGRNSSSHIGWMSGDLSFWSKLIGQFLLPYLLPRNWLTARNGASGITDQVNWEGSSA